MQCLYYATKIDLPMFHNLACLSFHFGSILWDVLPNLLHQAPNLAVLVFDTVCYAQIMIFFFSNNPGFFAGKSRMVQF